MALPPVAALARPGAGQDELAATASCACRFDPALLEVYEYLDIATVNERA
jgi:hypothetical protein